MPHWSQWSAAWHGLSHFLVNWTQSHIELLIVVALCLSALSALRIAITRNRRVLGCTWPLLAPGAVAYVAPVESMGWLRGWMLDSLGFWSLIILRWAIINRLRPRAQTRLYKSVAYRTQLRWP